MLSRAAVQVVIDTVLLETDAPDLLLARDIVGTPYLCSLVRVDFTGHLFLAVQISSNRLASLRSGQIDLRSVLAQPEMSMQYEGRLHRGSEENTIQLEALVE